MQSTSCSEIFAEIGHSLPQENSEDGERNVFSSRVGNHSEELSWERGLDSQWNSLVDTRMNSYATEVKWESKDSASPPVSVRKSSRIPKKRVLDGDDEEEAPSKQKQYRKAGESDEEQYQVEDELLGDDDDEIEGHFVGKRRKGKKITAAYDLVCEAKREVPELAASLVEDMFQSFSNKSKGTLSEAERQLRKEEAARKRRQQSEKAAKEIQAATIEKILGQNSQRKKREEKLRKQREEWQQERDATAMCPVKSIRWVLGPSGNIVSFSHDIELPKIFSGPCSYPKEREKCAGPACNNVYKYRDSKSNLPLCSLQCYRAIQ